MTTLYLAVVFCISAPADFPCDYGTWVDDGRNFQSSIELLTTVGGMSLDECIDKLKTMHERGNVVKFCQPSVCQPSGGEIAPGFHVEWDNPK